MSEKKTEQVGFLFVMLQTFFSLEKLINHFNYQFSKMPVFKISDTWQVCIFMITSRLPFYIFEYFNSSREKHIIFPYKTLTSALNTCNAMIFFNNIDFKRKNCFINIFIWLLCNVNNDYDINNKIFCYSLKITDIISQYFEIKESQMSFNSITPFFLV